MKRGVDVLLIAVLLTAASFFASVGLSMAHEPIFGLGAHTLYKGGYGFEVAFVREKAGDERESAIDYHIAYGITPDFTITLVVPQFLSKKEEGDSSSGLGDLSVRGKYRFLRYDEPGATTGVALNLAIKLPSGDETKTPKLGTGSADFAVGLAVTREGLKNYFFSDLRYRMKTEADDIRKGNVFFFDIAYGIRPWRIEYLKPDLVLLVELNWERESKTRVGKVKDPDIGGDHLFISPGFLLSYRNVMFKGGVQIPIDRDPNGGGEKADYRALFSIELHL